MAKTSHQDLLSRFVQTHGNPFRESVLRSSQELGIVDVPTIHHAAFTKLLGLVERARTDKRARIQVVLGEAGDGKTHLLSRLRRQALLSWQGQNPFAFASIESIRDPDAPYSQLLRQAAESLCFPFISLEEQPQSQLERMVWLALSEAFRELSIDPAPLNAAKQPFLATFLTLAQSDSSQQPESFFLRSQSIRQRRQVDADQWRAISSFLDPLRAPVALAWLQGVYLRDSDLEMAHLAPPIDSEDRAFRSLVSLTRMLDIPIVLAIDQVESVRRHGVNAAKYLLQSLVDLYQAAGPLVIVITCQTAIWPEMLQSIEQQLLDRIESDDINLRAISAEDAIGLCRARISPVWHSEGVENASDTFPFSHDELRSLVKRFPTPRRLLRQLADRLDEQASLQAVAIGNSPKAVFEELLQRENLQAPSRTPESRASLFCGVLASALERARSSARPIQNVVIRSLERVKLNTQSQSALVCELKSKGKSRRVYIEALNGSHGNSAAAAAKRLKLAPFTHQADCSILLREQCYELPKQASEILEQCPHCHILRINESELPIMAAIERLLDSTEEHELDSQLAADYALDLSSELDVTKKTLCAAFESFPQSKKGAPGGIALESRIVAHLSEERSVASLPHLAQALNVSPEDIRSAATALCSQGKVKLLTDRDQIQVLLRLP